jgi:hypothetical protein
MLLLCSGPAVTQCCAPPHLDIHAAWNLTLGFNSVISKHKNQKSHREDGSFGFMVEAAGQLIHFFRNGLDYAFILQAGCGASYPVR